MRPDAEVMALEAEVGASPATPAVLSRPSTLSVIPVFLRQAWHEQRVRWLRHIQFRARDNRRAREAYAAMDPWEFEGINARQAWANWRTIPKNLAGRVDGHPLRAVDLCCGTGQSTAVLAWHLPAGSEILGLEWSPRLVSVARERLYVTRAGAAASVCFRAQSVLETFRDCEGVPLRSGGVDLVNSSGAVGCHFEPEATAQLAVEVARVLRRGGLALIDSGPAGTGPAAVQAAFESLGFELVHRARSCFLDHYRQLCFRMGQAG
jgi:SAM-dependent methyltransferase